MVELARADLLITYCEGRTLLVEAKRIGRELEDAKFQLSYYQRILDPDIWVVSNGAAWFHRNKQTYEPNPPYDYWDAFHLDSSAAWSIEYVEDTLESWRCSNAKTNP